MLISKPYGQRSPIPRVWPAGGARLRETCDWAASIASGFCQRMGRHREGGSLRGPAAAAGAAQGTGPV